MPAENKINPSAQPAHSPTPWAYVYEGSYDWTIGPAADPQANPVCNIWCRNDALAQANAKLIVHAVNTLASREQRVADLEWENEFLHKMLSGFEWQRINSLSVTEVEKELADAGYSKERIAAGLAKVRAIIEKAIAARAALKGTP